MLAVTDIVLPASDGREAEEIARETTTEEDGVGVGQFGQRRLLAFVREGEFLKSRTRSAFTDAGCSFRFHRCGV